MFKEDFELYEGACDKARGELVFSMQEEFDNLSEDDCVDIIENYACEIRDIKAVYLSWEEAATETAKSLGVLTSENERYFDIDTYIEDLKVSEYFIELDTNTVIYVEK